MSNCNKKINTFDVTNKALEYSNAGFNRNNISNKLLVRSDKRQGYRLLQIKIKKGSHKMLDQQI